MNEEDLKKIIDEYSEVTKKHGLYSFEASDFVKQYEDNLVIHDLLRFSRQLLRHIKEAMGEDLGNIEDKVTYYEDGNKS